MTDQKQAPERIFPDWIDVGKGRCGFSNIDAVEGNSCRYVRKDLHDAAIKQRDELVAEVSDLESVLKDRDWPSAGTRLFSRALRAKSKTEAELDYADKELERVCSSLKEALAERDEALNQLDSARHSVDVLEKRVAALLAASAAREIAMRDRAATKGLDLDLEIDLSNSASAYRDTIKAAKANIQRLPLSPDGQQALDDVRERAWDQGYSRAYWGGGDDNPYRKPSRSSDAEDRG